MKQLLGSLTVLWMAFWLVNPLSVDSVYAQEDKPVAAVSSKNVTWNKALVKIQSVADESVQLTGLIVKAEADKALILTTNKSQPDDGGQMVTLLKGDLNVKVTSNDGKVHELRGRETNSMFRYPMTLPTTGANIYFVIVEVKHPGLALSTVPLADKVPPAELPVVTVARYWDDKNQAANIGHATVFAKIDAATSRKLQGQLIDSSLAESRLLTVHKPDGTLVGMFATDRLGGNFGGGGGFFSVVDPISDEPTNVPILFVSIVDVALELRQLGLPVSDAAIKLQTQRRRINTDAFGRPIQGKNLQITWSDDHKELHGFSNARGEWTKLSIKEQDVIIPIVGENVAAVSLDGKIAAYSPDVGQWDVMTLRPGSQMPPAVSTDIVTVKDGKDYYTFATSSGIWTSPTNPDYQKHSISLQITNSAGYKKLQQAMRATNNRAVAQTQGQGRMTISGPRHHVLAAEILAKEAFDVPRGFGADELTRPSGLVKATGKGAGPGVLSPVTSSAESESLNIAKQLRDASRTGESDKESLQKLRKLVAESFDQRLQKQKAAAAELRKKLQAIETAVQSREANRERIIERRVEELVDPNIDWTTLQSKSSSAGVSALPVAGSPIGLPAPDHIAVGSSAGKSKSGGSDDRDVLRHLK